MSEVITGEVEQFASTQLAILPRAAAVVVTSDAEAEGANVLLKSMREASNKLDEKRKELKAPSLEACRRIDAFFNGTIEQLDASVKVVKAKIAGYLEDKEKARAAEAARLKEIADKERKRLEDEARRKEAEAAAVRAKAAQEAENKRREAEEAERKRKEAEDAGNAKEAERQAGLAAKAAEQARTAQAAGDTKAASMETTAEATRQVAAAVPTAASMAPKTAAPKGFSTRKKYGANVVNFRALVEAVAKGDAPLSLLLPNETALRQRAESDKEDFKLAGCELTVKSI